MTDEQFDKLLEAINEVGQIVMVGALGLGIIIALIGLVIADLLK